MWHLLQDRIHSGEEVAKLHEPGNGICPLCVVPKMTHNIIFICHVARFLWSFVFKALGREWQALDLGEFLEEHANHFDRRRRLLWLVFASMTRTLWTICNKMVIERIFLRWTSDSVFKFLAFLQQWHAGGSTSGGTSLTYAVQPLSCSMA
jgi:hypothetical protein